jgi:hypothetical protein
MKEIFILSLILVALRFASFGQTENKTTYETLVIDIENKIPFFKIDVDKINGIKFTDNIQAVNQATDSLGAKTLMVATFRPIPIKDLQ